MEENKTGYSNIDEYIAQFPEDIREILNKLRQVIRDTATGAVEKISYQMPAFALHGNLVYFAVHKSHIGFYPTASGIEHFKDELVDYSFSKGAIQFPLDKPIPYELVKRITAFKVEENTRLAQEKANNKRKKK